MKRSFYDIIDMTLLEWIMGMVLFDVLCEQDIDPIKVVKRLELNEIKILMGKIEREEFIG